VSHPPGSCSPPLSSAARWAGLAGHSSTFTPNAAMGLDKAKPCEHACIGRTPTIGRNAVVGDGGAGCAWDHGRLPRRCGKRSTARKAR
jgi:hypothetical protein